jgi:8-oxo-dGTP pyrophosphatase MutT (NUDIX family)
VAGLIPASTVLLLRNGVSGPEVFMVRRHDRVAFMAGAHVFPGGRIDAADRGCAHEGWCDGLEYAAAQLPELPAIDAIAHHVGAIRELFEEAGILLARDESGRFLSLAGADALARFTEYRQDIHTARRALRDVIAREHLRLALDALVLWGHWVTPPSETRRFDARFFVTAAPPNQTPAHEDTETTDSGWSTPSDALARARAGEIMLPPPTWTTLAELEPLPSVTAALEWAGQRRVIRREPALIEEAGRTILLLPGDPRHPQKVADPPAVTRFVLVDGRWHPERSPT